MSVAGVIGTVNRTRECSVMRNQRNAVVVGILGLAASGAVAQFDASVWPGYKGGAKKWAYVKADGPATAHAFTLEEFATVSPGGFTVASDGSIYFKTHNLADVFDEMYVYRLDADGGVLAKSQDFGFVPASFGSYAGVAVGTDAVYTCIYRGAGDTSIVKLNKSTLKLIAEWTNGAFAGMRGTPLIGSVKNNNGNVNLYVHDRNAVLIHCVDSVTGDLKWSYPMIYDTSFGQIGPQWLTDDGRQAFAYFGNGDLGPGAAIADNGDGTYEVLWEATGPQNFNWFGCGALSEDGERIYVNTFNDGDTATLWAISVEDGSIVWSVPGNRDTDKELNFFCRPAVNGTRIYCAGGQGVVTAFDDLGGSYTQAWEYRDLEGEYTAVSGVETPDGRNYVYAVMQEDLATATKGKLLVLEDLGGSYSVVLETDLDGAMRRTLFGNNSATVDADGGLWIAGGRHDDLTVGDIYKFEVGGECDADLDGSGTLDLFDFLAFVNFFNAENPIADWDGDGDFTLFDFLGFVNSFNAGC
jgi:hypothetical protein